MKLLTLNFLTCAVKRCKQSAAATGVSQHASEASGEKTDGKMGQETGFPLHVRDAELSLAEVEFNPLFLRNVMPRIEWDAMKSIVEEVGLRLPDGVGHETGPAGTEPMDVDQSSQDPHQSKVEVAEEEDAKLKALHRVLLETHIDNGMLVCGSCGHQYMVKEGIPNFLLPPHLV